MSSETCETNTRILAEFLEPVRRDIGSTQLLCQVACVALALSLHHNRPELGLPRPVPYQQALAPDPDSPTIGTVNCMMRPGGYGQLTPHFILLAKPQNSTALLLDPTRDQMNSNQPYLVTPVRTISSMNQLGYKRPHPTEPHFDPHSNAIASAIQQLLQQNRRDTARGINLLPTLYDLDKAVFDIIGRPIFVLGLVKVLAMCLAALVGANTLITFSPSFELTPREVATLQLPQDNFYSQILTSLDYKRGNVILGTLPKHLQIAAILERHNTLT